MCSAVITQLSQSYLYLFCCLLALETFISFAKKLPCPDLYDVVEGYIKISMECAEIFKLLAVEKPVDKEVSESIEGIERTRVITDHVEPQCW